jgi:hypothetical protein
MGTLVEVDTPDEDAALAVAAILDEDHAARAEGRGSPHALAVLASWAMRGWAMPGGETRRRTEQVVALVRGTDRTALDWARENYTAKGRR